MGDERILFRQANDPDTQKNVLAELAKSTSPEIRGAVALNINTPSVIIDELLNENDPYVLSCLRLRAKRTKPFFVKANKVVGNNLIFRNADIGDAEFILSLRTDIDKSRYLSKTSPYLIKQEEWLRKYATDISQVYFIIENKKNEKIGTVRLYDQRENSFCWGSWIVKAGSPANYSIESALMVYLYAFSLGFKNAHFDVRKGNKSVVKFHERFGAVRTAETEEDILYEIGFDDIKKSLEKYNKHLSCNVEIY